MATRSTARKLHREISSALDSIDFLLAWEYTPGWVKEVLKLFKRQVERRIYG